MIQTCRPFDSVRFSTGGSVKVGSGPSAGGFERSGVCWGVALARPTATTQRPQRQKDHKDFFVIFVSL
jgi:hypothetical protein